MNYPTHNTIEVEALPSGTYLALFHGRFDPRQNMDSWGFDGPVIGPVKWVHTTYGTEMKVCLKEEEDFSVLIPIVEGCASFDGKYYGDWEVYQHHQRRLENQKVTNERRKE